MEYYTEYFISVLDQSSKHPPLKRLDRTWWSQLLLQSGSCLCSRWHSGCCFPIAISCVHYGPDENLELQNLVLLWSGMKILKMPKCLPKGLRREIWVCPECCCGTLFEKVIWVEKQLAGWFWIIMQRERAEARGKSIVHVYSIISQNGWCAGRCMSAALHVRALPCRYTVLSWGTGHFQIWNSVRERETDYLIRDMNCQYPFPAASQDNTI